MKYSSTVSIIYFTFNIAFLSALAVIVYNQGGHRLRSKSFLKDIWNQRKIYAPLIIHFYDTATDIGVIYNWFELMEKEQNNPDRDYKSVDMSIFFWGGITCLAVYRLCLLCFVVWEWLIDQTGEWYYVLLVLCDLYIFVPVYESFSEAQGVITSNAKRRKKRQTIQSEDDEEDEDPRDQLQKQPDDNEEEIEPVDKQKWVQLGEAVTESMPQIVLQSVFIIRSANDDMLEDSGSNVYLLMFSIVGSLFSISNKYVQAVDKDAVITSAKSLKPRRHFPGCVQYWYIIRVLWRLCQIASKFCIFVLIWVVIGGFWLIIWACSIWIYWVIVTLCVYGADREILCSDVLEAFVIGFINCIGLIIQNSSDWDNMTFNTCKCMESMIGIALITTFGVLPFECIACSDPITRQIFYGPNERIFIFWALNLFVFMLDSALILLMFGNNIL